jgi:hypothetical protein
MDGGLRKAEDIPADAAACDEVVHNQQQFRAVRGSGQQVLDASETAAAVAVVDETGAHNVAALSGKALSLGRTARAILEAHDAVDSNAGS